jgi:hypothetical protein
MVTSKAKRRSGGKSESRQLCLRGTLTPDIASLDFTTVCTCAVGMETAGFIFCEDAPWKCPKSVPPLSNTGVHDLGSAAASLDDCRSVESQNDSNK